MNTVMVLMLVIFAGILIVNGYEFDQRRADEGVEGEADAAATTVYKSHYLHKLRRKRDTPIIMCGKRLANKVAEACNSCPKDSETETISKRRRRHVAKFLDDSKIRIKRGGKENFSRFV